MSLENGVTFLWSKLAAIVDGIESVGKGLLAVRTAKALSALAGRAVFVGLWMAT